MITVTNGDGYIPYKNIKNQDSKLIFYPDLFSGKIFNKIIHNINYTDSYWIIALTTGLKMLTKKNYTITKQVNYSGSIIVLFLEDINFTVFNSNFPQEPIDKLELQAKKGSVVIFGSEFLKTNKFTLPESTIQFFEENYLPDIFVDTKNRSRYSKKVFSKLKPIRDKGPWKQCFNNDIHLEMIGKGCYGNVYKGYKDSVTFAVKFSKLSKESVSKPYSLDYVSWYEPFFLKDIFRPLVINNVCPNLPLIYDTFICEKYKLTIKNQEEEHPCVITVVELASGDLKNYFNSGPLAEDLVYSALFQIMAGLWAIQKYAQILHYDIKKENILFYKIRSGGYFHYKILGQDFYVPNLGYLFILNDFGLSRSMSPKYPMYKSEKDVAFRLGSRYAYISKGKFVPINVVENKNVQVQQVSWVGVGKTVTTSQGCEFLMSRHSKQILPDTIQENFAINLDFFNNPEIAPPFEFYNDTQDVIRMFTGGKRTTQNGNHSVPHNIPVKILKQLKKYSGPSESLKSGKFSTDPNNSSKFSKFSKTNPSQVVAGYFIRDFFKKHTDYSEKSGKEIISVYIL